jgi:type I restriction enzyme S subunit
VLRAGDVLISRGSGSRALVGRASRVQKVTEHTIFPDTSFRVRLDGERVLPEWFVLVWNAPATRAAFETRIRTTAGIWKLGWRDLREVVLRVPTLEEQRDAVEAYRAASARLDLALARRDRAARLLVRFEQAMVARAFAGRLVPQSDAEEDAAVLLDRIRARPVAPVTRRKRSKKDMASTRDRLRALISKAPEAGQTFAEIRLAVPAPYRELRDAVFEALGDGTVRQRFDEGRGAMVLTRAS